MPIQQLRLYDLLVDIIPGTISLILLAELMPHAFVAYLYSLPVGLASGVILIALGFIAGRIIHYISGKVSNFSFPIIYIIIIPMKEYENRERYDSPHQKILIWILKRVQFLFIEVRKSLPIEVKEERVDIWLKKGESAEPIINGESQQINPEVIQELNNEFYSRYGFQKNSPEVVRSFGYSALFGKQALYQRYNMLTTFFRNISFIFWVFSIITALQLVLPMLNIYIGDGNSYWLSFRYADLVPPFSLLLAVIFSRQLYETSQKRNWHLIVDYLREIEG